MVSSEVLGLERLRVELVEKGAELYLWERKARQLEEELATEREQVHGRATRHSGAELPLDRQGTRRSPVSAPISSRSFPLPVMRSHVWMLRWRSTDLGLL